MITIHNIKKSFNEIEILKGVSFVFNRGKTNLIIGQSGSGKTVLIKCMLGLFDADEGNILYDERDFTKMNSSQKKHIRKEVGMLFQGGALFDSMTVEENIMFPLTMFTNQTLEEKIDRVNTCLKRVNLENSNTKTPTELSGGMQKRVALARAIAMNPKYLFCDEPNSGLDPRTSIIIDNSIKEVTEEYNITTIINTHDMNSVMEIGDHILFIKNGLKEWEGTNKDILSTDNPAILDFVYSSNLFKKIRASQ